MTENYSLSSGRFQSATSWVPSPSQKNKMSVKRHNILNRGVPCGPCKGSFCSVYQVKIQIMKVLLLHALHRLGGEKALNKQMMNNGGERGGRRERKLKSRKEERKCCGLPYAKLENQQAASSLISRSHTYSVVTPTLIYKTPTKGSEVM